MQGRSVLSFLSTKKNPAPAGDEDGRMMPAARDDEREAMSQYIKSSLGGEELGGGGRRERSGSSLVKNLLEIQIAGRNLGVDQVIRVR